MFHQTLADCANAPSIVSLSQANPKRRLKVVRFVALSDTNFAGSLIYQYLFSNLSKEFSCSEVVYKKSSQHVIESFTSFGRKIWVCLGVQF